MKIRSGFVSNSSSSSFIVGFKKGEVPKTDEELRGLLFGERPAVEAYHGPFSTEKIAQDIFADMAKGPANPQQVLAACEGYWDDEPRESDDEWRLHRNLEGDQLREYWDKQDREHQDFIARKFAEVLLQTKGMELYTFEYGDEDGAYYSTLEHGEIFEKAPFHVQISRH